MRPEPPRTNSLSKYMASFYLQLQNLLSLPTFPTLQGKKLFRSYRPGSFEMPQTTLSDWNPSAPQFFSIQTQSDQPVWKEWIYYKGHLCPLFAYQDMRMDYMKLEFLQGSPAWRRRPDAQRKSLPPGKKLFRTSQIALTERFGAETMVGRTMPWLGCSVMHNSC